MCKLNKHTLYISLTNFSDCHQKNWILSQEHHQKRYPNSINRRPVIVSVPSYLVIKSGKCGILTRISLVTAIFAASATLFLDRIPDELQALAYIPKKIVNHRENEHNHSADSQKEFLNVVPSGRHASLLIVVCLFCHFFGLLIVCFSCPFSFFI